METFKIIFNNSLVPLDVLANLFEVTPPRNIALSILAVATFYYLVIRTFRFVFELENSYYAKRYGLAVLEERGYFAPDSVPDIAISKLKYEIFPISLQKTSEDFQNDLKFLEEHFEIKIAAIEKIKYGVFGRKSSLTIYLDQFPEKLDWSKSCPPLNPYEVYLGIDSFKRPVVVNMREESTFYLNGSPGSGKTFGIYSFIASFQKSAPQTKFLIASTKVDQDFGAYRANENVELFDPNETDQLSELLVACEKIKTEIVIRSKFLATKQLRHAADWAPYHPIVIILDEARQYLSKDSVKSNEARLALVKQLIVTVDSIVRQSRSAGIVVLLASQGDTIDELDISLRLLHNLLCSRTGTVQQSRNLFQSDIAYDTSLRSGKFILKSPGYHLPIKIKIAFHDPNLILIRHRTTENQR